MSSDHCKHCGSLNLKQTLTPDLKHYARVDCKDCGRFYKWAGNPETGGYKKELEALLEKAKNALPDDTFVKSLDDQFKQKGFLSNKQKDCIERIVNEIQ